VEIENESRTLRNQALTIVRNRILSGEMRPGDRINEVQLASDLAISRGTLREAIRNLEQEGLLVTVPHRGSTVRRVTAEEAAELQEVRLALETMAAKRVAETWSPAVADVLETRLSGLTEAYEGNASFSERLAADLGFHEAICECAGNAVLLRTWQSLIGHITTMVLNVGSKRMTPLQDPTAHRALAELIAEGDFGRIETGFAQHFAEGQEVVQAAFEESHEGGVDA
jgi:DNA-binding GntR family transcriptional regulator